MLFGSSVCILVYWEKSVTCFQNLVSLHNFLKVLGGSYWREFIDLDSDVSLLARVIRGAVKRMGYMYIEKNNLKTEFNSC